MLDGGGDEVLWGGAGFIVAGEDVAYVEKDIALKEGVYFELGREKLLKEIVLNIPAPPRPWEMFLAPPIVAEQGGGEGRGRAERMRSGEWVSRVRSKYGMRLIAEAQRRKEISRSDKERKEDDEEEGRESTQ